MAPRNKRTRRKVGPSKAPKRAHPKEMPLTATDPVIREETPSTTWPDEYLTLLRVMMVCSPAGILAAQVAFWKGLAGLPDIERGTAPNDPARAR